MNHAGKVRTRLVGRAAILDLEGDLTHEGEAPILRALHDPQVSACPLILLNFAAVGYINSAGISLLVGLLSEIHPSERALLICCLSPHYQKIFRMVGLTGFIRVFETEAAALEWAAA